MENFTEIVNLIDGWLVTGSSVLGLLSAVLGAFLIKTKKTENQLTKVIDKSVPKNESFQDLAKAEGLKLAAKALGKILK